MERFFCKKALKWYVGVLFILVVATVEYIILAGYDAKDALVEVLEDVVEYKTGMEFDFNGKEHDEEMMSKELPDFFFAGNPRIVVK